MNMDVAMKHTHLLMVVLYLLSMGIKVFLLLGGKLELLDKISKATRIPHIVVSTLLLVTGVYLMINSPVGMEPYILIKLVIVLATIPMGVIAFKKRNVMLANLMLLLTLGALVLAVTKPPFLSSAPPVQGENDPSAVYFKHNCNTCHGQDGNAGFQGAKPLSESTLSDEEIGDRIRNGKGVMPANAVVTDEELGQLIDFVKSLRK